MALFSWKSQFTTAYSVEKSISWFKISGFHTHRILKMTPNFGRVGQIFRRSKSIPCCSKTDRSRRFSNQIWILIAQNVALVAYVRLPLIRAVLLEFFTDKISENPKSKSGHFNSPPPVYVWFHTSEIFLVLNSVLWDEPRILMTEPYQWQAISPY